MPVMKLYWSPRSRSFTALWMLEEVGQPYDLVMIDITTGAQRSLEFLTVNPMGKVPALADGDACMAEAAAICAYIAERNPQAGLAPPLGDARRAKYLYWLFFAPSCIEPAMVQIATQLEMNSLAAGWGDSKRVFDVLEEALEEGPYLLGKQFTAADVAMASTLHFAVRQFGLVQARPSFDRYLDQCSARPAFQKAEKLAAGAA